MRNSIIEKVDSFRRQPTCTVQDAIDILAMIESHELGKTGGADIGSLSEIQNRFITFISEGIQSGQLHLTEDNLLTSKLKKYVPEMTAAIGFIVASPTLMSKGLADVSRKGKGKAHTAEALLKRSIYVGEFINYSKRQGKWLQIEIPLPLSDNNRATQIDKSGPQAQTVNRDVDSKVQPEGAESVHPDKLQDDQPGSGETKRGKPGADARWDKRKPMLDCGIEFMSNLINSCDCLCDHDKLSKIAYEYTRYQEKPLKSFDKSGVGLKAALREAARDLLPKERCYNTEYYNKEACNCPIPDHKKFPRRKTG